MKLKAILPIFLLITFVVLSSNDLFAICSDFEDCCNGDLPAFLCNTCTQIHGPCPSVPIDGGLSALLTAGIAYGSKKFYGKSKS